MAGPVLIISLFPLWYSCDIETLLISSSAKNKQFYGNFPVRWLTLVGGGWAQFYSLTLTNTNRWEAFPRTEARDLKPAVAEGAEGPDLECSCEVKCIYTPINPLNNQKT